MGKPAPDGFGIKARFVFMKNKISLEHAPYFTYVMALHFH
jgi:hypothetical protein